MRCRGWQLQVESGFGLRSSCLTRGATPPKKESTKLYWHSLGSVPQNRFASPAQLAWWFGPRGTLPRLQHSLITAVQKHTGGLLADACAGEKSSPAGMVLDFQGPGDPVPLALEKTSRIAVQTARTVGVTKILGRRDISCFDVDHRARQGGLSA